MYSLLGLMFLSSLTLILGYRSKLSSLLYLLSFTYLWLIDKGYYNNHYYLISLLLLLFCFIDSDRFLSISKKRNSKNRSWELILLQFQIAIVLIYGGFNKLNYWWMVKHEPVHHILMAKASSTGDDRWNSIFLEYLLVWGGVSFDILIVPLLLWKKTRKIAVLLFFIFNGLNTWIFYDIGEIGIFPLLMLSAIILFLDENYIRRALKKDSNRKIEDEKQNEGLSKTILLSNYVILFYIGFQLLFPLRHHLYPGNVDYTGEGQRFSWRMKSVYKDFSISFILEDEARDIRASLDPRTVLTVKQYTNLGYYPELILPVAENLRKAAIEKGLVDPKIYVDYKVGFMGLSKNYMIDPDRELSSLKYSPIRHSSWILPLNAE